tara:strand:+ start:479 stop:934 length:456 start_codon:yes stop_codon:yes gene_type:complete
MSAAFASDFLLEEAQRLCSGPYLCHYDSDTNTWARFYGPEALDSSSEGSSWNAPVIVGLVLSVAIPFTSIMVTRCLDWAAFSCEGCFGWMQDTGRQRQTNAIVAAINNFDGGIAVKSSNRDSCDQERRYSDLREQESLSEEERKQGRESFR